MVHFLQHSPIHSSLHSSQFRGSMVTSLCDPEIISKENKTDSEEHYFCFGNLSERAVLNLTETHVCNRFCRALGLQPPNAE